MSRETTGPPFALGAHMSVAGGIHEAVRRGAEVGATALQVFTKAPQRWAERELDDEEVEAFRAALAESEIRVTVSHDSYLINLASPREDLLRKSTAAFRAELERCLRLGLDYLVTHPGNATGGDREEALRRNAEALGSVLAEHPGETMVLLETTAGSGTALGWRFDEIARLLEAVPAPERSRLGVCLDTCHAWAAGYDLRDGYDEVMAEFDDAIGLDRLRLLHLNDSKHPMGSRKDRHAGIGEGTLGLEGFRPLMTDPRLHGVPRVIETPKGDDPPAADRRNLGHLREMAA
jgi:deoxyribonuclease-4